MHPKGGLQTYYAAAFAAASHAVISSAYLQASSRVSYRYSLNLKKSPSLGQRSKQSLSDLVFGKAVTVETAKRDRYGREVGKVLASGLDVNLEQVRRGLAWHYKAYEREQPAEDRTTYSTAEKEARAARLGLWTDPKPLPPWEFSHQLRRDSVVDQKWSCGALVRAGS